MRIQLPRPGSADDPLAPGFGLGAVDPPPPIDINERFGLTTFAVSPVSFHPFQMIDVNWAIAALTDADFDDYVFALMATDQVLDGDLAATGTTRFMAVRNTWLHITGRRQGSPGSSARTLRDGVALTVDESACHAIELPAQFIDAQIAEQLSELTSSTSQLRLRRYIDFSTRTVVEREVEPQWRVGVIGYYFPMEVVINNFFNADLDMTISIRFAVHHDDESDDLDVTIEHSSDIDFETIENILSLGHSSTAAATANRLIPLVLTCEAREAERDLARQILRLVDSELETHRLLAVRVVVPDDGPGSVSIVLCPIAEEPVRRSPATVA